MSGRCCVPTFLSVVPAMSHPVFQHHCIRCLGAVASCRWCSLCPGAVSPIVSVLFICGLGVAASVVLALLHLWCLGALVCCTLGLLRPLFRCWCPGAVAAVVLVRWCSWHSGAGVSVAPWHSSLLCWCILALSVGPAAVGLGVSLSRQCILGRLLLLPGVVLVCSGGCVGVSSHCCARCALWRPLFPCAGGPVVLLLLGWVVPFVVWRCPFVSWQCPGAVTCLGGCLAGGSSCCCVGLAELWVSLASLATAWRRWSGVFLRLCVFQGLSVFVGPAPSSLASLRCLGCLGGRFVVLGECWVVEGL